MISRTDFLIKHLHGKNILDIGNLAKSGMIHRILIDRFPESNIYGVDVVDQQSIGLNFPNQKIGSFEDLDYPNSFFDAIYIGEVLEHTWEPRKVILNCYRVLKNNGLLIVDTPNIYSLSRMVRYCLTGEDIILGDPDHKIFYSRAIMENLFQSCGFNILDLKTELSFDTVRLKFKLPNLWTFRFMGECLLVCAEKRSGNSK
jgi:ubiquinone/menaquinone biosynthesis C-methylase UbiE